MPTAVLLGTLDTKGREYGFVKERLHQCGVEVLTIDVGVLGNATVACDIAAEQVCEAAGAKLEGLRFDHEGSETRAVALETMQRGASVIVRRLRDEGRCDGILGLGGSGGSALVSAVMRTLPLGVPKVLVSTMASGDVSAYVGSSDLTIIHSVTDIAGINRISRLVLSNAAAALAGMLTSGAASNAESAEDRPAVGVTMLGVTTRGALRVAERLEQAGFDPIVFHAVGSGGRALESLIQDGVITGVVDFTIKEVTDELFGGVFYAGPDRLRSAGRAGYPQVVVPGAVEVINFGAVSTVPANLRDGSRPLVQHNAEVTAVRTTKKEGEEVARELADRLNIATGPVCVVIPTRGFDGYDVAGGPFHSPEADEAFITALTASLDPRIEIETVDTDINDPAFADVVAEAFLRVFDDNALSGRIAGASSEGDNHGP